MEDKGLIYIIRNEINNKVYIGKTIQPIKERWRHHLNKWSSCTKLKEAMDNLGRKNFYIEILEDNIPYSVLDDKEVFYIKHYNSVVNGYNSKEGNTKFRGRNNHKIVNSIKNRIIEDYINGISPKDIANHFKLSLTSVYNVLSESNTSKRYNKGGFNSKSKINLEKLIELKSQGYKTTYIANYFNVNKSSIKRYINRHKDIIFPRVSDILTSKVEDENVL